MALRAACIYGTMDQDERSSSLAAFARGAVQILLVTDVAARGLDIGGLDLVVNYDFPPKPKIFLHRSGRAGRAGQRGHVVSFVTPDELPYYAGAKEALDHDGAWSLQRVSRSAIEDELTQVDDAIRRSDALAVLKKGAEDSEKMYVKSRPAAKPVWLTLAKELEVEAGADSTEERVLAWRPQRTIFEQVSADPRQLELMRSIKKAHEGHVKHAEKFAKPAAPRPPIKLPETPRSRFFLNPTQEGHEATAIREVGVASLQDKVLDLVPEDHAGLLLQKQTKKWGKRSKKEKLVEAMASGRQAFIRNAVAQMEGVNPKGEKYRAWVDKSHRHIQDAGQVEKAIKPMTRKDILKARKEGRRQVRSELKTPEQIEKDRLIKMKHKLNDQGKHKEAAMLNAKIYKHKKLGKRGK
jgi:ATP-dependent RNA helicase DDX54/DBP10